MFETLQSKLNSVFRMLKGQGKITEKNVQEAIKTLKLSLLQADVNYKVVKDFINSVLDEALGEKVLSSLTPDQVFLKIVYDKLVELLGSKNEPLDLNSNPSVIMIVGLQGSGKTTTCAKLANFLKKKGRAPLLVAADVYRPAAIDQLVSLGNNIDVEVFSGDREDPIKIARGSIDHAKEKGYNVVIVDTAGRLHIDEKMMEELVKVREVSNPSEILMVVDAMVGQDAVNSAKEFNDKLNLTGFIVTKLDGDARGGVILSIRYVTAKPIKFVGKGEKIDDLEPFYPDRIVDRILGMGDIKSLVEKVEEVIDKEKAKEMERKFRRAEFTLEDFQEQLKQLQKMGPLTSLLEMLPGVSGNLKNIDIDEKKLKHIEAIINSMTLEERRNPKIINFSRKKRIAKGSGTSINEINRLLKGYEEMKKMMKRFSNKKMGKMKIPFNF
ncbi:MAG TPA: signal recognition particle protein [Thermotogaceae bacterium]|nr:signal recognition particle protein [Thermotogaceae bacterium]